MKRYSYERISPDSEGRTHFRISDWQDNRIATCYDETNARLVVGTMNAGLIASGQAGDPRPLAMQQRPPRSVNRSEDVTTLSREELNTLEAEYRPDGYKGDRVVPVMDFRRLLATARAGLEDAALLDSDAGVTLPNGQPGRLTWRAMASLTAIDAARGVRSTPKASLTGEKA